MLLYGPQQLSNKTTLTGEIKVQVEWESNVSYPAKPTLELSHHTVFPEGRKVNIQLTVMSSSEY